MAITVATSASSPETLTTQAWASSVGGWIDFSDALTTRLYGPDADCTAGETITLDVDPADAAGRWSLKCSLVGATALLDEARMEYRFGHVGPGEDPSAGSYAGATEFVCIFQAYITTPTTTDTFKNVQIVSVTSSGGLVFDINLRQTAGGWNQYQANTEAGLQTVTNGNAITLRDFLDQWTTYAIHYQQESSGGAADGFLKFYGQSGRQTDAASVISGGSVIYERTGISTTRTADKLFLGPVIGSAFTDPISIDIHTEKIAWSDGSRLDGSGNPTAVIPHANPSAGATDFALLGQLRDISDDSVGWWARFPPQAYKDAWLTHGTIQFRLEFRENGTGGWTAADEGWQSATVATHWALSDVATGSGLANLATSPYEFRVGVKRSDDAGNTDVVYGPTLNYTPPTGSVKVGIGHCISDDGRAQPYRAIEGMLNAGATAFWFVDDIGYYDDGPGNINLRGTFNDGTAGMYTGLLQVFSDRFFAQAAQTGPVVLKPGDHQWADAITWENRDGAGTVGGQTYANLFSRGTTVWDAWVSPGYIGRGSTTEKWRGYGWGSCLIVVPDDVSARDPDSGASSSLIGTNLTSPTDDQTATPGTASEAATQNADLKAYWNGTDKPWIVLTPVRVHTRVSGSHNGEVGGIDNWGYTSGAIDYLPEWEALIADIGTNAPGARAIIVSGDRHYVECHRPQGRYDDGIVFAELTCGPMASVQWGTTSTVPTTDDSVQFGSYRDVSQGASSGSTWNTNYGVLTISATAASVDAYTAHSVEGGSSTSRVSGVIVAAGGGRTRGRPGRFR